MQRRHCLHPIFIFTLLFCGVASHLFSQETDAQLVYSQEVLAEPFLAKPAIGETYRDPVFHTKITRLTDAVAEQNKGFVCYYAKLNPFNADESKILIYQRGGKWRLYDISGQFLKEVPVKNTQTDSQPRWHPTDPNVLFWFNANTIVKHNIESATSEDIAQFQDYQFITNFDEGNYSADGTLLAIAGKNWPWRTGLQEFFVYDLVNKKQVGPKIPATGHEVDWLSISPSGEYMVVHVAFKQGGEQWQGTDVYKVPEMTWQPYPYYIYSDHADIGIDELGDEVYVTDNAESVYPDRLRHIEKFRLSDGAKTDLLGLKWGLSMLISCRNLGVPGWAIVSTYSLPERLASPDIYPFQDEIFAVKLDGSYEVRRLAHHRSQRFSVGDYSYNNYWDQPNAVSSTSGDFILFSSNWRELDAPEDVYLMDLRDQAGWIVSRYVPDTDPPTPPTAVTVQAESNLLRK
ncbi:MAG: hypothetical protein H6695_04305 [Deferribacteres bacterium]|nr:hypothetical protein [candidate division KSB1 bacterium]MCB9509375.1 hypothetical protein [Deferribacteres bacterium]